MTMIGRLLAVVVSAILDERFGSSWTRLEEVDLLCEVRGRDIFLWLCLLGVEQVVRMVKVSCAE